MEHVKMCGMMHLLSGHFETEDRLYQTLEHVHINFSSIYKAVVSRLDEEPNGGEIKKQAGLLITFCRCLLKRMFEEDGITINRTLADLLAEIELHLMGLLKDCAENVNKWPALFYEQTYLTKRIGDAYFTPSPICYQLVNYDLMMEFLDQCVQDLEYLSTLHKNNRVPKENFIVLRNYIELLANDRIDGNSLKKVLIDVESVVYEMARHSFFVKMCNNFTRNQHYGRTCFSKCTQSGFRFGVLKALVLQSDVYSGSGPLMSDELVIEYVKCIQDNILELLVNDKIHWTETLKRQVMNLREGLLFLMHLLITWPSKHNLEQKKLSTIRLDFQALVRDVGSIIYSCFVNHEIEEKCIELFGLIEKTDVIIGEIIETICCIALKKTEQASPKQDDLGSLISVLRNLKEFKDSKPSLIVTWKDNMNLVFFIFYLIENYTIRGNLIGDDDFSRNILQLDVAVIDHEELNNVLISAQVVTFNMACDFLLMRYGKLRWWELYLGTKEHVDMHMCVGILKAIVLSSTTPLTDERLIAYGECVLDTLMELLKDEDFDTEDHFDNLHTGLSILRRLLISYRNEHNKLSQIRVGVQDLMRSVASAVCSCFSNWSWRTTELSNLVEKMDIIFAETEKLLHLVNLNKIGRESPKTNPLGSINLLLENWKELIECESDLIITWKNQFQMIHENFVLFKLFITSNTTRDDETQNLCCSIVDAGYVMEYLLTLFSVGTCPVPCASLWISEFTGHVELIKAAVMKAIEKQGNVKKLSISGKDRSQVSAQALLVPTSTDLVVGFDVEMELIRKRLGGHLKQLEVISVVGMPGLGKTTLARKVYEDLFTRKYFDTRAWCCVSQEYNKKEMFLTILSSIIPVTDEIRRQSDSELSVIVHKQLTRRRYFIVLDDIWDVDVFMELKRFFPDDNNGSRIMLTTRSKVIGSQAQAGDPIEPRTLTDEQSWDLLEQKVYTQGKCPSQLSPIGKEIARKCRGLPLAVVVVGGVLAKGAQTQDFWDQVTNNLNLYLARDSQSQFMAALELSYEFLPDWLKPMFLYFGAFPEDKEIPVNKLMRLWMAEGFVQKMESTNLENQAEKNLMDLIDRSLVMVAKRRTDGRVKACLVHDLLRDMCIAKAKEEKFMQQVHVRSELPDHVMYQRRLSVHLHGNDDATFRHLVTYEDLPVFSVIPPICSLLFFHVGVDDIRLYAPKGIALAISSLKLLKVFDAEMFKVTQDVFDEDLIMLVQLRYLSFYCELRSIPPSISRLRCLETLIIRHADHSFNIPETIWEMTKLKHLHIKNINFSGWTDNQFILENLETLSTPHIQVGKVEKISSKVPGLKKLRCILKTCDAHQIHQFPNFESFSKLESLEVMYFDTAKLTGQLKLPITLKKLCISVLRLNWSQISTFSALPSLEALELRSGCVSDEYLDMEDDDAFTNLKVLMLHDLNIKRWFASSLNFPNLEKLVITACSELEGIPSELGEIDTLREIHVSRCGSSVVKTAKAIQKEQEEFGNESLKFYLYSNKED